MSTAQLHVAAFWRPLTSPTVKKHFYRQFKREFAMTAYGVRVREEERVSY